MCGLKLGTRIVATWGRVTPHVGVWIETTTDGVVKEVFVEVTPHVGVWIETPFLRYSFNL